MLDPRARLSSFLVRLLVACTMSLAAATATSSCSATVAPYGSDAGDTSATSPLPRDGGTDVTEPSPELPRDAAFPDAATPLDRRPRFELAIDGKPTPIETVTVKIEPATAERPARINVEGQYEQPLGHGLTSTAVFTLRMAVDAKGTEVCGVGERGASYLFQEKRGTIVILSTGAGASSCTMRILGNQADGFSSGDATGMLGVDEQMTFTVRWGQAMPPF